MAQMSLLMIYLMTNARICTVHFTIIIELLNPPLLWNFFLGALECRYRYYHSSSSWPAISLTLRYYLVL